jgi:hypothetical protein
MSASACADLYQFALFRRFEMTDLHRRAGFASDPNGFSYSF